MPELLFPYLVSVVATLAVILSALWAFTMSYRRAIDYAKREARLPLATRWEDLSDRVADLHEEWDQLRDQLQQAKTLIEESQREREWLAQNKDEVAQMRLEREQLERVRADLVQTQEDYAVARQRLEEAELARAKADFSCQQLEERSRWLEQRISEQQKGLQDHEERLVAVRTELADVQSRLDAAKRQLAVCNEALAAAQERLNIMQAEVKELARQRDLLKRQNEQLDADTATLRSTAAELQEQAAQYQQRVKDLDNRIAELRGEERKRDKSLASSDEAMAELWHPAIALGEFKKPATATSEHKALERAYAYLASLNLKFSKRVVDALHTSLKVARDTPLLVLAGISGTGKSLLPRRYAEAMGIHFLGIPVQPRWDGPQDLLGFFNYLENRYKATDLIRALLQFDPFAPDRKWIPNSYDCMADDRVLMVLLDEMNLARVEYYFSEFLSRLETRRDLVNVNNDADRMKAEIPLDIGRFGEEADCRVFVDTNVLFVGTMNEDESTLTLSDKVIDRANVIRFGRPKSLALSSPDALAQSDRLRADGYLSRSVWSRWIVEGTEQVLPNEVEEWISDLNAALARVGRPFGFRTRNAIRAYVQQYPDRTDEGMRFALADQIEQRVLPKLRGVDPADDAGQRCIEGVKRVVQATQDSHLLAAIDHGISSQSGQLFAWLGVERPDDVP
ncbi:MAG: hypothetical protein SF069_06445 [Phycisphaerae bacterium]|nr:hypothetical protein [Phycisphaerae bacterium]